MQGGRTLIIVGVVILVLVLLVGGVLLIAGNLLPGRSTPEPTAAATERAGGEGGEEPPPEGMVQIVVSAQNPIPRGTRITAENNAVKTAMWPRGSVPEGTLVDVNAAYGRIARTEIAIDMPITEHNTTTKAGDIAAMGSDAALMLPPGKVAYALPVARWSGVAWAIQPGDHVDVLISLLIVDLDEDFQTELPNVTVAITEGPEGEQGTTTTIIGRLEALPDGTLVMATPSEDTQRPRLVTQMVVQDALVLRVGDWEREEEKEEKPTPEGEAPTPEPTPEGGAPQKATAQMSFELHKSVTLGIAPQDALVLKYLEELGASIDLVLRSASDAGNIYTTQAVTLDYIFERYAMEVPPKLPYGPTPPIYDLDPTRVPRRTSDSTSLDMTVTVEGSAEPSADY